MAVRRIMACTLTRKPGHERTDTHAAARRTAEAACARARRLGRPRRGERIRFKGKYEYNDKGGVIHWTHHDPKGWHEDDWIEYDGEVYG